jgi:hypothetical protein
MSEWPVLHHLAKPGKLGRRDLVKVHHSTTFDTSPLFNTAKVRSNLRQLHPPLTRQDARPCHFPRRFGPYPRRPPWLPVDPRPALQPLPLPRGPPQQLALRPSQEGFRLQVLGIHGSVPLAPLQVRWLTEIATGFSLPFLLAGKDFWLRAILTYSALTPPVPQSGRQRRTSLKCSAFKCGHGFRATRGLGICRINGGPAKTVLDIPRQFHCLSSMLQLRWLRLRARHSATCTIT